jgi:metal-sulfur cluster biosynthetic enzyme
VYDPELNYNVVDLGLVYDIDVEDGNVRILMTLTTPLCPIGPMVEEQVREKLALFPGVKDVQVEFTFDPPWNPSRMSEEAKFALGIG